MLLAAASIEPGVRDGVNPGWVGMGALMTSQDILRLPFAADP